MFKKIYSGHFQYEHCWLLLKDFPEWVHTTPSENPRKEIPQTLDIIDQRGRVDDIMDFEKPIGRKAEKTNWNKKDDEKDFSVK